MDKANKFWIYLKYVGTSKFEGCIRNKNLFMDQTQFVVVYRVDGKKPTQKQKHERMTGGKSLLELWVTTFLPY